jgi:dihydroxy-acid dehydratase
MGTASTMTSLAEALGLALPGTANIPAVDSRRMAAAERAGRRIVELVAEDLKPSQILTKAAFENAIATLMALGGSTNAVIHLLAIAGRVGVDLTLDDFDRISRTTPFLVNVKPSGEFLMEDLFEAGGVPAVMKEILPLLHKDAITVTGRTIEANIQATECLNHKVVRAFADPLYSEGGMARYSSRRPLRRICCITRAKRWCLRTTRTCTRASIILICRSMQTPYWC